MNIEQGKRYITRGGQIVGPIKLNNCNSAYLYKAFDARGILLWGEDGSYWVGRRDHDLDLVAEHIQPVCATPPDTTADRLIDRLHQVTAFYRFETGDRVAAAASLSEEAAYIIKAQAEEIARLREALHYYANCENPTPNEGPWGLNSVDFGKVARAALETKNV